MHINNGSVLKNGSISWTWLNVLFWRTFFALILHYLALMITCSLSLKLGWLSRREYDSQNPDVVARPPEDTVSLFAFVRQPFYHKTLAYTIKEKERRRQNKFSLATLFNRGDLGQQRAKQEAELTRIDNKKLEEQRDMLRKRRTAHLMSQGLETNS